MATPSSSLRGLRHVTLALERKGQRAEDAARMLGRMLLVDGVCPHLVGLALVARDGPDRAFMEGAMSMTGGAATIHLETLDLTVCNNRLTEAGILQALARGPDGAFSRLRTLTLCVGKQDLRAFLVHATNAPADAHDWTSSVAELGFTNIVGGLVGVITTAFASARPQSIFPELKRISIKGRRDQRQGRIQEVLFQAYRDGKRSHQVMVSTKPWG